MNWLTLLPWLCFSSVAAQRVTSFEDAPLGAFTSLDIEVGRLRAAPGSAAITAEFARSGKRSLRLLGGPGSQLELELESAGGPVAELVFWAERWTRRSPFAFTIEAHDGSGWSLVHQDAGQLRVGARFLSELRIELGPGVERLRLRCTAPAETGVLIDDLRLLPPSPARLEAARVARPTLPALVGNPWNPLARIDLQLSGTEDRPRLTRVALDLASCSDLGALDQVALFHGPRELDHNDPRAALDEARLFARPQDVDGAQLVFEGDFELPRGSAHLWVAASLSADADLDARLGVACGELRIGGRTLVPEDQDPGHTQRLGVALRSRGDDGSAAFRIPGLCTTNEGTLIAVYDVRWKGWADLPGDLDVGLRRSTDGGRTWDEQRLIMDLGGEDKETWHGDGVGDPAVLVDRQTGTIFVLAVWSHGDRGWHGSGPGLEPEETGQLLLVESGDDGKTWSAPRNLTREVKDPSWSFLLQGPGRGISMHDGTLVFPAQFQAPPEARRTPFASVLTSRDHGQSWSMGNGAKPDTTEAAVVELQDGSLMLNMRDNRGGTRSVYGSLDLGLSWVEHPTSRVALIEPVCMASLIHVGRELAGDADGRLIFSNPNVAEAPRRRMTLQVSDDYGASWRPGGLLLDEGQSAGYSCLTMIDEATVGILYEGSRAHLTFQRIPLAELFPARAAPADPKRVR